MLEPHSLMDASCQAVCYDNLFKQKWKISLAYKVATLDLGHSRELLIIFKIHNFGVNPVLFCDLSAKNYIGLNDCRAREYMCT